MPVLKIYIDGSSQGNPGRAGISLVVYDEKGNLQRKTSEYIGVATNNVAEYTALIYALQEALILGEKEVAIFTDSELIYKQMRGSYKVKDDNLKRLYKQANHLIKGFKKVDIEWIKREENKEADKLAKQIARKVS